MRRLNQLSNFSRIFDWSVEYSTEPALNWNMMHLIDLLYLLVSTRAVIGQFSRPYSPVRSAKI